jgi:HEAT repeat protein
MDNRLIAVESLGNLGSQQALPQFEEILEDLNADVYLLREILQAVAKIDHPRSRQLLEKALRHPFPVVRHLAEELLKRYIDIHQ